MTHRIAHLSFAEGRVLCDCSAVIEAPTQPAFDRDEALAAAWLDHRRATGSPHAKDSFGSDHDGRERAFRINR